MTKKNLREIYEDTQKLEQGVLGTPKIWDRVSPGNLARVSNLWPAQKSPELCTWEPVEGGEDTWTEGGGGGGKAP